MGSGKGDMNWWYETKMFIEHSTSVSPDALHMIAGLAVVTAAAILLKRSLADGIPMLVLMGALLLNEATDLWVEQWPSPHMQYGEAARDLILTMVVPIFVFVTARYAPRLYRRPVEHLREPSGTDVSGPSAAPDSASVRP